MCHLLTRALELARKRGLIDANPSKDAARPRTIRSKPFAPTAREVRELLGASAERDAEVTDAAIVLATSAVRKGELLAVRWEDIDLDVERSTSEQRSQTAVGRRRGLQGD